MGWQDREYAQQQGHRGGRGSYYRPARMHAYDMVTKILLANIAIYFLMFYTGRLGQQITVYGVMQAKAVWYGQVWRLLTATYMHADFMHIFFNMLMLYFLGPHVERQWGSRQFLIVYTLGGVLGNVLITVLALTGFISPMIPGLGASGSVWTVMAAAAVFFPNAELLIYFLFPIRLRTAVIFYGVFFIFNVVNQGSNYGGDLCHLAGLAFGVWWAYSGGFRWAGGTGARFSGPGLGERLGRRWQRLRGHRPTASAPGLRDRVKQRQIDSQTVDRILAKVYDQGIHALSPEERSALSEATERLNADKAPSG